MRELRGLGGEDLPGRASGGASRRMGLPRTNFTRRAAGVDHRPSAASPVDRSAPLHSFRQPGSTKGSGSALPLSPSLSLPLSPSLVEPCHRWRRQRRRRRVHSSAQESPGCMEGGGPEKGSQARPGWGLGGSEGQRRGIQSLSMKWPLIFLVSKSWG